MKTESGWNKRTEGRNPEKFESDHEEGRIWPVKPELKVLEKLNEQKCVWWKA